MSILSSNGCIGVAKQAAFGTPVGPVANLFIKYLSESLANEQEDIKGVEGGQNRNIIEAYKSTNKVVGDVTFYARPDVAGFFIGMLMGKDTFVAKVPATTPSVHTFEPAIPHFFTIARDVDPATPTLVEWFQDCQINSLTIEGESSQPIKMTASIQGTKGVKKVAADVPTYEVNDPLMYFDAPVFTLVGGVTVELAKYSIKINQNTDLWYGPTMTPATMINKLLTIDVNFTLKFIDATEYARVYYGGATAIVDVIADGSFHALHTYGAADLMRTLDINIKHLKTMSAPVHLAGEAGAIFQEVVAYGVKIGADNLCDIIVKNSFDTDYDT